MGDMIREKTNFFDYSINWSKSAIHMVQKRIVGEEKYRVKKYSGDPILFGQAGNDEIRQLIETGRPGLVARFGSTELRTSINYLEKCLGIRKNYSKKITEAMATCSGFFPNNEENLDRFGNLFLKSCKEIDILAVWFNLQEDYVYKRFGPSNGKCVHLDSLEPFWFEKPWTVALTGKKVLVIHPFAETIEAQYQKRDRLFPKAEVLPDFELKTIKAVQSLGGKCGMFSKWFDALDYMYMRTKEIDYDVAIIGCGAYGMPLAARLKMDGKIAIHMGGVTQFLFGIKGGRWDERPQYSSFYNEYWCRPDASDRPLVADKVENACYW